MYSLEFTNSLNNTISGIYILAAGDIPKAPTAACVANGYIGQLTVQVSAVFMTYPCTTDASKATDFSVLAMAVSTLVIVSQSTVTSDSPMKIKILTTAAIWTFPCISSTVIASLHAFGPVSGNWCWIIERRNDLRYGLAHGIRFDILLATITIYTIVFRIVKKKMMSTLASSSNQYGTASGHLATVQGGDELVEKDIEMANLISKSTLVTVSIDAGSGPIPRSQISTQNDTSLSDIHRAGQIPSTVEYNGESKMKKHEARAVQNRTKQNMARIMLMRAYPFAYVLLWIPGIANRLAELAGHPVEALVILQASTQCIGFVDSILYIIQWRLYRND